MVGAAAAGLALGLVYLWQPAPPSLLAPVLVHAAITCGFLSLGPYLIYRWTPHPNPPPQGGREIS